MWLLLGSLSCCFLQVSCRYYTSSGVGNRTLATGSCNLARPNITFSKENNAVNLDKDILDDQQKAWIGYTNTYEIFHYIGCVLISDLNESIPHIKVNTTNDPGQCYSACKHSRMFGIRKTVWRDCFCFETDVVSQIKSTQNKCDVTCLNSSFACGSAESLSLYEKAKIDKEKANVDRCLAYKNSNDTYVWAKCDRVRRAVCIEDINDTSSLKDGGFIWERAMDTCFSNDEYPISITNIQLNKNYWTAYINALIINDSEDFQTHKVFKYGYIQREDDDIYLRFTKNPKKNMIALCSEEPTTSTTTTTTTKPTTEVTRSSKASTFAISSTDQSSTFISLVTRTTKLVESSDESTQPPHMDAQVSGDDKTGVYVAVPLVIIVGASVVVVVVVVCYRNKRGQQSQETEHKEILPRNNPMYNNVEDEVCYMNTVDQTDGLSMALENSTNISKELQQAKIDPKLDIQSHSTDIGDARGIYDFAQEVGDGVPNVHMSENSYFVLEKIDVMPQVYSKVDKTVELSPEQNTIPSDQATDTYYNTAVCNMDVDNYDHIGKRRITAKDDGHYDTTLSDDKGDSLYDTTNVPAPRHAVNDETYNSTDCPNDYDFANNTCRKEDNYANASCNDVYSFADVDDN